MSDTTPAMHDYRLHPLRDGDLIEAITDGLDQIDALDELDEMGVDTSVERICALITDEHNARNLQNEAGIYNDEFCIVIHVTEEKLASGASLIVALVANESGIGWRMGVSRAYRAVLHNVGTVFAMHSRFQRDNLREAFVWAAGGLATV